MKKLSEKTPTEAIIEAIERQAILIEALSASVLKIQDQIDSIVKVLKIQQNTIQTIVGDSNVS